MAIHIKDFLKIINSACLEFIDGLADKYTKDIGNKVIARVLGL